MRRGTQSNLLTHRQTQLHINKSVFTFQFSVSSWDQMCPNSDCACWSVSQHICNKANSSWLLTPKLGQQHVIVGNWKLPVWGSCDEQGLFSKCSLLVFHILLTDVVSHHISVLGTITARTFNEHYAALFLFCEHVYIPQIGSTVLCKRACWIVYVLLYQSGLSEPWYLF